MKVIIQIPCFNEEHTLAATLADLPRSIPGVDSVEWLVINDGSTDRTIEVARANGVDHILDLAHNRGLASAYAAGLEAALRAGADIIVNTDADNQYCGHDIPKLVEPILCGQAELVIGERPISDIRDFSWSKKLLQRVGSWVVRVASGTRVPDAPSGFRAMTREAALRTNVFSEYTYTLETIIQAGQKNMTVTSVPIRTNRQLRESRLVRSVPDYLRRSAATICRIFVTYRPMRSFWTVGAVVFGGGFLIGLRFLYLLLTGAGEGNIQSLILGAVLLLAGVFLFVIGVVADLIAVNRKLLERVEERTRRLELMLHANPRPTMEDRISEPKGPGERATAATAALRD